MMLGITITAMSGGGVVLIVSGTLYIIFYSLEPQNSSIINVTTLIKYMTSLA